MAKSETPTFNLKAVVQETGLKPDTLRAWERRYGLPTPTRTTGGHRLYSQRDINILKWLLERQEEGLSISRAVDMWRRVAVDGKDPLHVMALNEAPLTLPSFLSVEAGEIITELRQSWIDAGLAFDEHKAELVMAEAFSYYPPETVCIELLQKALSIIGNGWYTGEVSVQQEHFTSALALRRLDALLAAVAAPTRSGRVIIGCPPGENHTFGPLLITFLLRRRGWNVVYLGADVPTNRLHATIISTRPDLVVFSAQLLESAASLREVALYLQEKEVVVAFGGTIFNRIPDVRRRIPGHFLGTELNRVPQVIEQLIMTRPPFPPTDAPDPQYTATLEYFRERTGLLHSHIWQGLNQSNGPKYELTSANDYLTRSIVAALRLGDLDYINADLNWVEGLIINYNIPAEHLHNYMNLYHQAAERYLTAPGGRLIVEWLAKLTDDQRPPTADVGLRTEIGGPRSAVSSQ